MWASSSKICHTVAKKTSKLGIAVLINGNQSLAQFSDQKEKSVSYSYCTKIEEDASTL
jgi:hypothetical protein